MKYKLSHPHLPIILIFLLAASLYLYQLGTESFWMDELISVDQAKDLTLKQAFTGIRPLFHTLLKVWLFFGTGDAWLRGLNVLFMLGSLPLLYSLSLRLVSRKIAIIATLLMSLSPLVIHHAQEVRMYALSTFLGLGGTLIFTHALDKPKFSFISGWVICRWLAIITTPLNLLLLLPDTLICGWNFRHQRHLWIKFGGGILAIFLLWSPWLITAAHRSAEFMGEIQTPRTVNTSLKRRDSPDWLTILFQPSRFTAWSFGRPISNAIYWFYNLYSILVVGVLGIALFSQRQQNSDRLGWAATWGLVPLIPILVASYLSRSLWVDRYLLFTAPYIFILLAAGFNKIWEKWRLGAGAILVIYTLAIGGALKRYYTVLDRADWRSAVQLLNDQSQPQDLIVWSVNHQTFPRAYNHYYSGSSQLAVKPVRTAAERKDEVTIKAWLEDIPKTSSPIWFVYADPSQPLVSVLEEKFVIQDRQKFDKVDIFLLTPRDGEKSLSPNAF